MKYLMALLLLSTSVFADIDVNFYDPESIVRTAERTNMKYPSVRDILYRHINYKYNPEDSVIYVTKTDYEYTKVDATTYEPVDAPVYIPSLDPNLITPENMPEPGDWVEVTNSPTFETFATGVFHQYMNDNELTLGVWPEVMTIIASDGDANYAYWRYGRIIIDGDPVVIEPLEHSRQALVGALDRYINQLDGDQVKSARSYAESLSDRDILLERIEFIKQFINDNY